MSTILFVLWAIFCLVVDTIKYEMVYTIAEVGENTKSLLPSVYPCAVGIYGGDGGIRLLDINPDRIGIGVNNYGTSRTGIGIGDHTATRTSVGILILGTYGATTKDVADVEKPP